MATFNIPATLPQPATHYPFQPGEAVYYLPYPAGFCNMQQLIPAIVVKAQPAVVTTLNTAARVAILRKDRTRVNNVEGLNLAYQGYCSFCGVPAVLDCEALVCPKCHQPATAVPPPDELTLRIFPIEHSSGSQIARISFLTGCTWGDALTELHKHQRDPFNALLDKHRMLHEMYGRQGPWTEENGQWYWFSNVMQWYAELGDEDSFLAYYRAHASNGLLPSERADAWREMFACLTEGDGPGRASQRLQLPPLDIPRIAEDSEPDGVDAMTDWLDQQFKRAA